MKKWKTALLVILIVVFSFTGIIVYQNFGNIRAIYYAYKYKNFDYSKISVDSDTQLKDYIKKNPQYHVRPANDTEQKLYDDGLLTDDEFKNILTEKNSVEGILGGTVILGDEDKYVYNSSIIADKDLLLQIKNENTNKTNDGNKTESEKNEEKKKDHSDEISECIAKMYVIKSTFMSRLDNLVSQGMDEYDALKGQNISDAKMQIAKKYYVYLSNLEAECDKQVDEVLQKLESLLKLDKQDTSIVSKMRDSYNNEKSLKKAEYINAYNS